MECFDDLPLSSIDRYGSHVGLLEVSLDTNMKQDIIRGYSGHNIW